MADRTPAIPAVDKLARTELLALVMIVSAGRLGELDIAMARYDAAYLRFQQKSEALGDAIRDYTKAREQYDKAKAEGRSTKGSGRALDAARAAYVRADAAASDAYARSSSRYAELQRIRDGEAS